MKWFRNLKIGAKLVFGFSVMILFMGVIGLTGYRSVNSIEHYLDEIFSVRLPSIDYLIEADRDLQQLLVAERSMIFADTKSDLFKELVAEHETKLKQSDELWQKYKALPTTAEDKKIIAEYEIAREEWKAITTRVVDGRKADTREMTASVKEIAQNSEKARCTTGEAVSQANSASERVAELGQAAQEIGKVTATITEISEQTNLLALNATIELKFKTKTKDLKIAIILKTFFHCNPPDGWRASKTPRDFSDGHAI